MAVDAILFDLDGTLIDSYPGILQALQQVISEVLPERSPLITKELIGPPIQQIFRFLLGERDDSTMAELVKRYRDLYDNTTACLGVRLFPTVRDTLRTLQERGVDCYILTNKPMIPTRQILQHLDIASCFVGVITPDLNARSFKSKDEMARYAVEHYGLTKDATLFVGDSKDDAAAALACDFRFYPVTYGYGTAHLGQENALSSLSELLGRL